MNTETIRWLHLSDLHLGQRGGELWWQVRDEFRQSLLEMIGRIGPPHLVLLTGDLTNQAKPEEYELVDRFLDALVEWILGAGAPEPLIVAVPGNHDLARPPGNRAFQYAFLDQYSDLESPTVRGVRKLMWEDRNTSPVASLFGAYSEWLERRIVPELEDRAVELTRSYFTGDLSLIVEPTPGFKLGLVGLNTAWTQYRGGDFEKKLQLETAQFQAALPSKPDGSPLDWFKEVDLAILLTHHPRSWLAEKALSAYLAEIHPPGRFALALYGHMHQGQSEVVSVSGTEPRAFFQSPSLFGLEHYGTKSEARAMGYAWGRVTTDGEVRVWPLARVQRGDGSFSFDRDQRFEPVKDDLGGVILRPGRRPAPSLAPLSPSVTSPTAKGPEGGVLNDYLTWARGFFGKLDLVGLGGGDLPMNLDEVYVPLCMSARGERDHSHKVRTTEEAECFLDHCSPPVELDQALTMAGTRGLFILGQPGSGKTTALKKLLWECLKDGTPDAGRIGLPRDTVPVFLRARSFLDRREGQEFGAFLGRTIEHLSKTEIPASFGPSLWSRGKVLLLVDGLDELADTPFRARIAQELEALARARAVDGVRVVISCRYSGLDDERSVKLSHDHFMILDVPNLTSDQTRELVTRWFTVAEAALARGRGEDIGAARVEGARRGEELADTLETEEYATRQVRELVRNPLLLTLLCIVVLRGGEIPKRRVDFFHRCLETLLGRWSKERTVAPLLEPSSALELIGPLAWQMHVEGRKYDYSVNDMRPVLHDRLDRLQTELRRPSLTLRNLVRWLHQTTGVLTEYAPGEYGFMHLSLQEYLAARYAAVEHLSKELVDHLERDEKRWWREVLRLHVGLGEHRTFAPLMQEVLAHREPRDLLLEEKHFLTKCVEDAQHPDFKPLRDLIADEEESPERRAVALELMLGHVDKGLVALAKPLAQARPDKGETPLSAMAARVVDVGGASTSDNVFVEPTTGIRFLKVPAGIFMMGDTGITSDEVPIHQVRISSPFWLGETPVTNHQYGVFLESTKHEEPQWWGDDRFNGDDHPVVGVSWHDAVAFCTWLSKSSGRHVALPTEAQWEFAARGPENRRYPWGDVPEPDETRAWFRETSGGTTRPVGRLPAGRGPFGHLDLAGNVWEWCLDVWNVNAYKGREGRVTIDPIVQEGDADTHSLRGGCWFDPAQSLRAALRRGHPARGRLRFVGFRLLSAPASARDPKGSRGFAPGDVNLR